MALNYLFLGVCEKDMCLNAPKEVIFSSLLEDLTSRGVETTSFYYMHDGSPIEDYSSCLEITATEETACVVVIRAYSRIFGGKGGFGALIRAMGMRMNRNRNKDACRDLSGRRLRYVNVEKKVTELMKKEPERKQKEAEEKAEKRRLLLEGPRHMFNDQEYIEQLEATQDNFEDALKQGLKSNKGNGVKRKGDNRKEDEGPRKRTKLWVEPVEGLDSDEIDSHDEEEDSEERALLIQPSSSNGGPEIDISSLPPVHLPQSIEVPLEGPSSQEPVPPVRGEELESKPDQTPGNSSDHTPLPDVKDDGKLEDKSREPLIPVFAIEEFDLANYSSLEELEAIGGNALKQVLQKKGLKCGGTPHERAVRLWSIKGKQLDEIDPSLLATGKGRSRNKGKKKE